MRQHLPNVALFFILAAGFAAGVWYVDKTFFPKPEPKPAPPPRETVQALAGAVVGETKPAADWPVTSKLDPKPEEKPKEAPPVPIVPPPVSIIEPPELVALGGEGYFKQALLTTRGGAVQQVILNKFDEANRLGHEVRTADGKPQALRLIPGVVRPRDKTTLTTEAPFPVLVVGKVADPSILSEPSYVLLHYPAEDDPVRQPNDADRMNDKFPSAELGDRTWTVTSRSQPTDASQSVTFETTLAAPYFLKLRKTYTLGPKDYHIGMALEVIPLPGREKGKGKFKYQIVGPRGIPLEGEYYAPTYRNVLVGWQAPNGAAKRTTEDAASIATKYGGEDVVKGENQLVYAAVATPYFSSALCVDDEQTPTVKSGILSRARPTREPHPWDSPEHLFFSDVTFRAVSTILDPTGTDTVTHKFIIYNGPSKVRLLKQMTGDKEVDPKLVDRYLDGLTLKTITDYHSPNFLGRLANSIFWTDVVITFTNLMHSLLGFLHGLGLPWGVSIMLLTVMVRLTLFIPSRKQQMTMARMQEKMAKMKPELDKLQEKYKDNPQALQQEKAKLMFKYGVNPVSTMGGCLLLFAQMPVFMGLYYCLQESVFFRLEPFLWFDNLSAPDMLIWWTEKIPYISAPDGIGGSVYLGPYFNILPVIASSLIFAQQWLTMPPPTDEQQEMQQKMMKFMVIFMAIFFYKVPAGLCIYFICSTSWALMERKLIPKPKPKIVDPAAEAVAGKTAVEEMPEAGGGGFLSRMKAKIESMQDQAEGQRQIRNDQQPGRGPDRNKDKKKKRRK